MRVFHLPFLATLCFVLLTASTRKAEDLLPAGGKAAAAPLLHRDSPTGLRVERDAADAGLAAPAVGVGSGQLHTNAGGTAARHGRRGEERPFFAVGRRLDAFNCTPVLWATSGRDGSTGDGISPKGAAARLLQIHVVYTSSKNSSSSSGNNAAVLLAANLVESIVASLTHFPDAADQLLFDGVCIGLHPALPPTQSDATATAAANQQSMEAFGSASYYAALKAKHAIFTGIVEQAQQQTGSAPQADGMEVMADVNPLWRNAAKDARDGSSLLHSRAVPRHAQLLRVPRHAQLLRVPRHAQLLPWALFLDADTQVFRGWAAYVSGLLRNTSVAAHCGANYIGAHSSCAKAAPPTNRSGQAKPTKEAAGTAGGAARSSSDSVSVFFQREGRKYINTGVVLVRLTSPAVRCLYRQALRRFKAERYGDQTAIQRVLKDIHHNEGHCTESSTHTNATGAAAAPAIGTLQHPEDRVAAAAAASGEAAPPSPLRLHHYVFDRRHVNAAVLDPTRLVVQHAHMSGVFKAQHLLASATRMNASTSSVSGAFLRLAIGQKRGMQRDMGDEGLCADQDSSSGNGAFSPCHVAQLLVAEAQCGHRAHLCSGGGGGSARQSTRRRYTAQEDGGSAAAGDGQPHAALLRDASGTNSTNSSSDTAQFGVGAGGTYGARMMRANEESVGFWWTVVPALIVLATLFFYHYMVSR